MENSHGPTAKQTLRTPGVIVLLYALFSAGWIAGSDRLLSWLLQDPDQFARIGTLKGMLFIAVTGTLLYLLLKTWHRSLTDAIRASMQDRERLERAINGTNDGWWEWDRASGCIYYAPRCADMLGTALAELPRDAGAWRDLVHADDVARAALAADEMRASDRQSGVVELRLRHKAGHYVPVLLRYLIQRNGDGVPVRVSGTGMDLTERVRADERLRQAAAVFETTLEGVVVTDCHHRIVMVNRAFCEITGYSESEVVGMSPNILRSGRHPPDFYRAMWASIGASGHWRGEIWNRRKNGEVYPQLLSISAVKNDAGTVINYVGVFADISRLKESESRLEFLAHHDALTQLPNRLLLLSRLEHAISAAQRDHARLAVLMLDLDRFKDVNDSFGHGAGDELLRQVAERLASRLRGADTVARLGGDEFTVMLERIAHPEDAALVANEIMTSLNQPWTLSNGADVHIGVSIGISIYPDHGSSTQDLLQHADTALYQAKHAGRGCFRYFSPSLPHTARDRVETEIRQAPRD